MKPKSFLSFLYLFSWSLLLSGLLVSNICLGANHIKTSKVKAPAGSSITVKNLMIAYNVQSNAKEKFLVFAKKADEDGYKKAAQLFRAAADSAQVLARNSAKALTDMGITPAATLRNHKIRSTRENLERSVKSEGYKAKKMYPKFKTQAETDNIKNAIILFGSAAKVASNRKKLFENALKNLDSMKNQSKGFFVCQICGNLVEVIDFTDCPVCGYPASEYKIIS